MFPPKPSFQPITSNTTRQSLLGPFEYISAPVKGNPENISFKGTWAKDNIIMVPLPEMIGVAGFPEGGRIAFHRKAAKQLQAMVAEWEAEGLIDDIHHWDGSFCPRFIRGSKTTLSNHAFGTAFDINAQWNPLGKAPAVDGKLGCLYRLVPIANKHGFYWGGHYQNRPDGMHFELAKLL